MDLTVKLLDGTNFKLSVSSNALVKDIKRQIQKLRHIDSTQQRLFYVSFTYPDKLKDESHISAEMKEIYLVIKAKIIEATPRNPMPKIQGTRYSVQQLLDYQSKFMDIDEKKYNAIPENVHLIDVNREDYITQFIQRLLANNNAKTSYWKPKQEVQKEQKKVKTMVGVSEELMQKLEKLNFDQSKLTTTELLEMRFKDYTSVYVEGIPMDEYDEMDIAEHFGVDSSLVHVYNFKGQMKREWSSCHIHFDEICRDDCEQLIADIMAHKYDYDGFDIRANYGLLKYCENWTVNKNDEDCYRWRVNKCRYMHGFYRNFERADIHTVEMEKALKALPCGPKLKVMGERFKRTNAK